MKSQSINPSEIHLNLRVRGLKKSATLAINERVAALRKEGKKIYSFGLGQSPFPVPACVVNELKKNAHQKDYLPVQGLTQLCEAVAEFHQRIDTIPIKAENVIIGPGSKELMFLLQLCFYGDTLLTAPCWVSYEPQAQIIGKNIHYLQTSFENNWQLSANELEDFCKDDPTKARLIILNYPSNPCSTSYSRENLRKIAEVARKYKIIILSDEIYGLVNHRGEHFSIANYYPEGTIISSGLSKWCGAGGWRLGTFAFPDELKWLKDALTVVASETFTSVSAPIQHASVLAFKGNDEIEKYLHHSRRILKALGDWIVKALRNAGVKLQDTEGAFYILPDFSEHKEKFKQRGIHTSKQLCETILLETGVASLPGSSFGLANSDLFLRMSYVDFNGEKALEGSMQESQDLDEVFLNQYCPNVLEGIRKLVEWID